MTGAGSALARTASIKQELSVSLAETNAFLNAETKVTGYLQQFMDSAGWLHDANVPPDVRANVDGVLKNFYADQAEQLKDRLNEWEASLNPPEASLFFDTLRAFSAAMEAGDAFTEQYRQVMKTIVHGATRVAIGFVPVVGQALDLCEAVTGREWCMTSGRELTTGERIMSGIGFGLPGAVAKVFKRIALAPIKPEAKVVMQKIAGMGEKGPEFADLLISSRRSVYKSLKGSVEELANPFETQAGVYLMKNEGRAMLGVSDDGVRKMLDIPFESPANTTLGVAPDFLTVTSGNKLVLSEVKGGNSVIVSKAIDQLTNAVKKLKEKNMMGDLGHVEIIMKKGAGFDLSKWSTKDGYLFDTINNKTVALEGFPLVFIKVVEI